MFQMAILLQFNDAMSRSMTELMDATLLPKEVLQQVTEILVKNELLLVWYIAVNMCTYNYEHMLYIYR